MISDIFTFIPIAWLQLYRPQDAIYMTRYFSKPKLQAMPLERFCRFHLTRSQVTDDTIYPHLL